MVAKKFRTAYLLFCHLNKLLELIGYLRQTHHSQNPAVNYWLKITFPPVPPHTDDTKRTKRRASYLGYGPNRGILLQAGSIGGIN